MAEMARDYYDSIQTKDCPDEYGRIMATNITLEKCSVQLSKMEFNEMDKNLTTDDIAQALRLSNNGKSPGLDGIPHEFYILDIIFRQSLGTVSQKFDILGSLNRLYTDIETYGIAECSKFNAGWLCPIFKKGDKSLTSNYCPVTLLNCDYKLMTNSYSLRLMNVAPSLVKPDQAGFMKRRKIEDQVKLAQFLLNYAEAAEEDGL
jgi:hypothetical protein